MNILITAEIDKDNLGYLKEIGNVEFKGWNVDYTKFEENELIELLEGVDIFVTSYDKVTKKVIDACKDLKLIVCTRANPVNIDSKAAKDRGIPVVFTPGRNSDSAAEFTIGLMLSIARKIPQIHKELKDGNFLGDKSQNATKEGLKADVTWSMGDQSPYILFKGTQLKGRTLGIIGFGSIGRRVGAIAKAFGMRLLIFDPFIPDFEINEASQKKVELEELFKESDFITLHTKVDESTIGMINKDTLSLMKESAYLINSSRGAMVVEEDLIEALRKGTIAGAALDVFENEPIDKNSPLINELDNVVITAHLAGATWDVITNHTEVTVAEIKRFVNGQQLLFQFNR